MFRCLFRPGQGLFYLFLARTQMILHFPTSEVFPSNQPGSEWEGRQPWAVRSDAQTRAGRSQTWSGWSCCRGSCTRSRLSWGSSYHCVGFGHRPRCCCPSCRFRRRQWRCGWCLVSSPSLVSCYHLTHIHNLKMKKTFIGNPTKFVIVVTLQLNYRTVEL